MEVIEIKDNIEKILDNNKARNITIIDLKNKSYIADYMIVASGTSSRHLQSLSEILVSELKKLGLNNCRMEGKDSSDWKLVDAYDVIVHIFHPEKREFYNLEKMWSEEIPKEKAMI
ncbi:ribosome silencing factor [Candidatus Pelagibacter bacterium]|nr:ribosome silencing factor [Candidatus Pelagibacter bacterium]MDC0447763.1 ribosome silencing factor [Pelagibacteraceae bacterium]